MACSLDLPCEMQPGSESASATHQPSSPGWSTTCGILIQESTTFTGWRQTQGAPTDAHESTRIRMCSCADAPAFFLCIGGPVHLSVPADDSSPGIPKAPKRGPSCFRSRFGSPHLHSDGPVARPHRRGLATLTSNRSSWRSAAEASLTPLTPVRRAALRRTRLLERESRSTTSHSMPPFGGGTADGLVAVPGSLGVPSARGLRRRVRCAVA